MRESFIFYKSFYESIKELDSDTQSKIYNAIMEYQFNKNEVNLSGVSKSIFTLIKPQLDANNSRYENGKKGGRPKTETKPNQNQTKTKLKPNVNVNENENVNVNVNVNENVIKENNKRKVFKPPSLEEVKKYCNERNNGIDAESFIDFYEAKGWMIGKNKIKDWKACIRTWERNRKPKEEKATPSWFEQEIKEEEIDDETRRLIEEIEGTSPHSS